MLGNNPTMYLDEIQQALVEALGELYPVSILHDKLRQCLGLTLKVARHVHPAQSLIKCAQWSIDIANMPAEFLVFVGKCLLHVSLLTC